MGIIITNSCIQTGIGKTIIKKENFVLKTII